MVEKRERNAIIFRVLLAVLTLWVVLSLISMEHIVVISSVGASAFIEFLTPYNKFAKTRNIVGGHLVGLLFGSIWHLALPFLSPPLAYSFAVGSTMIAMVYLDCEHPPAAGTALGVCITGFSYGVALFVFISVFSLVVGHKVLIFLVRKYHPEEIPPN